MEHSTVLVRAIGGKPARLVAVDVGSGLIYAANPASLERVAVGESWPVGFPEEDVFEFDEKAYEALSEKWRRLGALSRDDWRAFKLKRYRTIH